MLDKGIGKNVDASLEIIDALGEKVKGLNKGGGLELYCQHVLIYLLDR